MELQQKYRDQGLEVVVLSEEPAEVLKAAGLAEAPVTVLPDAGHVFKSYGVEGIPHTIYFNRKGRVEADFNGYSPELMDALEKRLSP